MTMTEHITKEQARDALLYLDDDLAFVPEDRIEEISNAWNDEICRLPAADVAPVVHGEWRYVGSNWECSNCLFPVYSQSKFYRYCPQCGARMDGGESE